VSRLTIKVPQRGVYIAELSNTVGWRGLVTRLLCGSTVTYRSVDLHYIQEQSPLTSTIHAQPWKMEDGLGGVRPHTTGEIRDKGVRLVGGGLDAQTVSPRHLQSAVMRCWLRYPSYLQRVCRKPTSAPTERTSSRTECPHSVPMACLYHTPSSTSIDPRGWIRPGTRHRASG
jgi:hypothetical protein